jgi:uncharacterized membrane protein YidH (DUF202 family)
MTAAPGRKSPGDGPDDDPEEREVALARERTSFAWARTAIAFAAVGGVVLKANVVTGLIILAISPVIWYLGQVTRGSAAGADRSAMGSARVLMIVGAIVLISLLCLAVAIFGKASPGVLLPPGRA